LVSEGESESGEVNDENSDEEFQASAILSKEEREHYCAYFDEFREKFFETSQKRIAIMDFDPILRRKMHESAEENELFHWTEDDILYISNMDGDALKSKTVAKK
jgi:hypothetical protein